MGIVAHGVLYKAFSAFEIAFTNQLPDEMAKRLHFLLLVFHMDAFHRDSLLCDSLPYRVISIAKTA